MRSPGALKKTKTIPNAKHIGIVFPFAARLQNCEIKSNRAGLGCANPNKVPEDTNSFLADDAKLALALEALAFWGGRFLCFVAPDKKAQEDSLLRFGMSA